MFDETYVHWVKNETDDPGDPVLRHRAAVEQPADDPHQPQGQCLPRHRAAEHRRRAGGRHQPGVCLEQAFSNKLSTHVKQFKRTNPKAYRVLRPVLAVVVAYLLYRWLF